MENKLVFDDVEEVREYTVKPHSGSGRIYVPGAWVGRRVKVILLKEEDS